MWLGANNALGTVVTLQINQTPNDPQNRPHELPHADRARINWNPRHPAGVPEVMKRSGVSVHGELDWPGIFASDRLYTEPISVMHELYNKDWLAKYLLERFSKRRQPL